MFGVSALTWYTVIATESLCVIINEFIDIRWQMEDICQNFLGLIVIFVVWIIFLGTFYAQEFG